MKYSIKVVCSWCDTFQGMKDSDVAGVTHTICKSCLSKMETKLKERENGKRNYSERRAED